MENRNLLLNDDANDDAIVGTILNRRAVLRHAARATFALATGGLLLQGSDAFAAHAALQKQAQKTVKLVASPAVTEGPFYVDEKLNRSDLIGKATRASIANGVPLDLTFTLYRLNNGVFAPLKNAVVDMWQADAHGVYSDEDAPMNHENTAGENWLRGYQVSDKNGVVHFKTIFPGWYESRTTHIHFKVRESDTTNAKTKTTKEFTSQLFFDDKLADTIFAHTPYKPRGDRQVRNTNDMVFTERQTDGTQAGQHLTVAVAPSKTGRGYASTFAVALTDTNLRSGGHRGHGPGGFGGPGGPGGPPPGGFGGPPPQGPPPQGPPPQGPPPGGFGGGPDDW